MSEERCEKCVYFKPYAFAPDKGDCLTHKNKRYETRSINTCDHFTAEEIDRLDLIQAPERREYKIYVNVYDGPGQFLFGYKNEGIAKNCVTPDAIATAVPTYVTIEGKKIVIHGEGEINKGENNESGN